MSSALVKRGRRRRRRNVRGDVSWGWIATGAALGGAASFANDTLGKGLSLGNAGVPQTVAYDALGGAGAGMFLAGVLGGVIASSPPTAAVGVIGGIIAFVAGTALNSTRVGT